MNERIYSWNERIYSWTENMQTKAEEIFSRNRGAWVVLVNEIEEDANVVCVHTDEIRFMRSCTDEQYEASKKRAISLIQKYYKKYC